MILLGFMLFVGLHACVVYGLESSLRGCVVLKLLNNSCSRSENTVNLILFMLLYILIYTCTTNSYQLT